ncbi:MAG: type II toxin-antitoxin system RelE/ParE family toxin [Candidatus Omnitrophota bacterium]|jgi:proteic killer suppression protein|nr:MAG: type II toxin-antitoxin system RelE/ParE family toxin [Candidatus Omnitrophota bacterium]
MIKSFLCKETERIFNRESAGKIPKEIQRIALRKLFLLHSATSLEDLKSPPANRLEQLKGDRKGQFSIRINNRYRICFVWIGYDAYDVEIVDYH